MKHPNMSKTGSENSKPLTDATTPKWFDLIYKEEDFARNVAIGVGAAAGLPLAWDQPTAPFFAAAMAFSIVKLLAGPWKEARERKREKRRLKELFDTLGHEERSVVEGFVSHGGSVILWGDLDKSSKFSDAGIDSLMNRQLVSAGLTVDGRQTFVLDAPLYDYAKEDFLNRLFES